MEKIKKVILAYSGGLDTSIIVKWLKDKYGCEVVCYTADLGQNEPMQPIKVKSFENRRIGSIYRGSKRRVVRLYYRRNKSGRPL